MWEMQQLGRRAGAPDVGLISSRLEEMALLPSSAQGLDEGDVAMFESRAAQVDRSHCFQLGMRGGARGADSLLRCVDLV